MPEVCVGRNLDITAPALAMEPWSVPRMVSQVSGNSAGEGAIASSGLVNQPGRLMVDLSMSWTSDSPIDLMMRFQVFRAYRTIITSNPNMVQIWDSWNWAIDKPALTPNSYNLVNSLCTLGIDWGTDNNAQPYAGKFTNDFPATASEEWYTLPAGKTLNIKYQSYCWTPPPWSNNANANTPVHEAYARSAKLRLWAFPTADQEVR